jgi:hypothetical protein
MKAKSSASKMMMIPMVIARNVETFCLISTSSHEIETLGVKISERHADLG